VGNYESARVSFEKAREHGMEHHDLEFMIAMSYMQSEKLEKAIEHFDACLMERPDDIEACFNKGMTYARMGRIEAARDVFLQALELEPEHDDALYNLGVAYAFLEQMDEARQQFEKAVSINPGHILAQNALTELTKSE
jgi:tetratricopeptide (TPR) repeat protein